MHMHQAALAAEDVERCAPHTFVDWRHGACVACFCITPDGVRDDYYICVAVCCSVLQWVAVCGSVLQYVAECCSVLQ